VFNALSTGNVHQAFFKISILLLGSSFADPFLLSPLPAMAADPSRAQIQQVQRAFQAFNDRDLRNAEVLFDQSVQAWEQLERPRDEMAALVKARGNVKVDLKKFEAAIEDFDRVLSIMSVDGTKTDGSGEAAYSEYPDVFVQRGLAWKRDASGPRTQMQHYSDVTSRNLPDPLIKSLPPLYFPSTRRG
jgi:tetratricopeptide (TPR) repeat protein